MRMMKGVWCKYNIQERDGISGMLVSTVGRHKKESLSGTQQRRSERGPFFYWYLSSWALVFPFEECSPLFILWTSVASSQGQWGLKNWRFFGYLRWWCITVTLWVQYISLTKLHHTKTHICSLSLSLCLCQTLQRPTTPWHCLQINDIWC